MAVHSTAPEALAASTMPAPRPACRWARVERNARLHSGASATSTIVLGACRATSRATEPEKGECRGLLPPTPLLRERDARNPPSPSATVSPLPLLLLPLESGIRRTTPSSPAVKSSAEEEGPPPHSPAPPPLVSRKLSASTGPSATPLSASPLPPHRMSHETTEPQPVAPNRSHGSVGWPCAARMGGGAPPGGEGVEKICAPPTLLPVPPLRRSNRWRDGPLSVKEGGRGGGEGAAWSHHRTRHPHPAASTMSGL